MTRSPRRQGIHLLSLVFAALPFTFALIRALQSRYDLRMLWMALAALVGEAVVVAASRALARDSAGTLAVAAAALVVGMLLAGWTAMRLGATAPAGIWPVAFVLAFCWAASFTLHARSRRPAAGHATGGR